MLSKYWPYINLLYQTVDPSKRAPSGKEAYYFEVAIGQAGSRLGLGLGVGVG